MIPERQYAGVLYEKMGEPKKAHMSFNNALEYVKSCCQLFHRLKHRYVVSFTCLSRPLTKEHTHVQSHIETVGCI